MGFKLESRAHHIDEKFNGAMISLRRSTLKHLPNGEILMKPRIPLKRFELTSCKKGCCYETQHGTTRYRE